MDDLKEVDNSAGEGENAPTETAEVPQKTMPLYQCHKKVWALKINSVVLDRTIAREQGRDTDGSAMITPEEEGYAPFRVSAEYIDKHKPHNGGYFVQYEDGYQSFSPAEVLEKGYTLID